jgi:Tfp pilus assembly pilus retraction ATPase PilT
VARIDAFLKLGTQQRCSDIHLAVGVPPMLRLHGDLVPIKFRDLRDTELEGYIGEILTPSQSEHFGRGQDLDFSYISADGGRFRVNVFRKDTGVGAAFRAIPSDIPSLTALGLPPIVTKLCDYHQGMILVTGSTGTGKSTTLAAMIDLLNSTRRLNIISLEDPIEFVHRSKMSQVIQRELGTHIPSFAEGVRAADGHGRRALVEVMITTRAVAKLIQSDQTHQIPSQLQMGREHGMQLFDQALQQALHDRQIDPDDAYNYASDKRLFQKYVTDTSILARPDTGSTGTSHSASLASGVHKTAE